MGKLSNFQQPFFELSKTGVSPKCIICQDRNIASVLCTKEIWCRSFAYLFVYSFVCSFVCSFVPSFVCSFVCYFVGSFVRSFICVVRSFICQFVSLFLRLFLRSFLRLFCSFLYLLVCSFVYLSVSCFVSLREMPLSKEEIQDPEMHFASNKILLVFRFYKQLIIVR